MSQTHRIRAHIGLSHGSRAREHNLACIEQRACTRRRVSAHRFLCTIIGHLARLTGDCDCHRGLVDRQLTVRSQCEGYILKVGVIVAELGRIQFHVVGTRIGLCHSRGAARADHLGRVEQRACTRGRVATDRMLLRIVSRFVGVADDCDGHRGRSDGLIAVRHAEGHRIKIRIRIVEHAAD